MIEYLRQWVLTIAGVAVFGSICDTILPGGNFRKYIRLAIGLVLILTMLTPIQKFMQKKVDIYDSFYKTSFDVETASVAETDTASIAKLYKYNLEKNIQVKLAEHLNKGDIKVSCGIEEKNKNEFGKIKNVEIILSNKINEQEFNAVKKELNETYAILPQTITIKYKEGTDR